MGHTLFISDLHLSTERPHINRQFFGFVEGIACHAEALYILGDLFEHWIGDDDLEDPVGAAVAASLAGLHGRGVKVALMQGNRDLLLGQSFADRCGAQLIADPALLDLYGTATLAMHGDTLCTDDLSYQEWRTYARAPSIQQQFLAQPIAARHEQMKDLRRRSEAHKHESDTEIMDVAESAVIEALRTHGYPRLIHGHTHRPARHLHLVDGHACERWVLNDWYERGGYLRCDAGGCAASLL